MTEKNPKADLRLQYPRVIEASLLVVLLLMILLFVGWKEVAHKPPLARIEEVTIKVEDIPITHQIKPPPPPALPTIPLESDDPDIPPDATIPDPDWDPTLEMPLPPFESDVYEYYAVEEVPELKGGARAIYDYIKRENLFPPMAVSAGVGGACIIYFVVDETGKPTDIEVFQEDPVGLGFGEAGMKAIAAMKFKPGRQHDRYVPVRMSQVIKFAIK